jgi:hypothetical protein
MKIAGLVALRYSLYLLRQFMRYTRIVFGIHFRCLWSFVFGHRIYIGVTILRILHFTLTLLSYYTLLDI